MTDNKHRVHEPVDDKNVCECFHGRIYLLQYIAMIWFLFFLSSDNCTARKKSNAIAIGDI